MAVGLILFGVAWLGLTVASADPNVATRRLMAGAISITVPPGWQGKVFRRAPEGSVLLQLANLPFVRGQVPKQQPRGDRRRLRPSARRNENAPLDQPTLAIEASRSLIS
jgi:hypothetical protein